MPGEMVAQWGLRASKLVVAALVSLAQRIRVKAAHAGRVLHPQHRARRQREVASQCGDAPVRLALQMRCGS